MIRLVAVAAAMLAFLSCSKEPEKSPPPAVSEEKSVVEELLEQTLKNPKDAEAWYHLADVYERTARYREAADALDKVVALDPNRGSAYLKLGTVYNRLGRHQEAV